MKVSIVITLLSLCFFACQKTEDNQNNSSAGVEESTDLIANCFNIYKDAILDQDGEKAVAQLSQSTIDEYQMYLDMALTADKEKLDSLSLITRMTIITYRHRVPHETLRELDGKKAIIYAVDRDWIGKNGVIQTELGEITVNNERATAKIVIGGKITQSFFQFKHENDSWKFDLRSVLMEGNNALKITADQSGMDEDQFMFMVIESISGKKVDESIWTPPGV